MIRGKFLAQDDIDVAGHRILNWKWLDDLPTDGAADGQVIVYSSNGVTWATLSASGVVSVDWDDILNKPSEYPPEAHTQDWGTITGKPTFVNSVTGSTYIDVSATTGTNVVVRFTDNAEETFHFFAGALIESASVLVTADSTDVTFSVEAKTSGGDLTACGFGEYGTLSATSITLTPAVTDTSPQRNYIYATSNLTVTKSVTGWPTTAPYYPLADVLLQKADTTAVHGALKFHAWTDHIHDAQDGHLGHLNFWIRQQNATWQSGMGLTYNDGVGILDFAVDAGSALQLHPHGFPAIDITTGDVHVVNDPTAPYKRVQTMAGELTDSTGASMAGKYYSLVVWAVVSERDADCQLMVNLPSGSYNTQALADADAQGYTDYSVPTSFKGCAVLVAELKVRHQNPSTYTVTDTVDLRGKNPDILGGAQGAAVSDHGLLAGLGDKDHPTTALQQTGATTNQGLVWDGTDWSPAAIVNSVTAGTNLTVSATNGTGISIATVTNPTFAGEVNVQDRVVCTSVVVNASNNPAVQWYHSGVLAAKMYIQTANPNLLRIHTVTPTGNNYQHMVFDRDTNRVGINTAAPSYELDVTGDIRATAALIAGGVVQAANVRSYGDVYVNYNGPDADAYIYFYDGTSTTGQHLRWDDSPGQFEFSDALYVDGNIRSNNSLLADSNVYVNYDGPDGTSVLYFYEDSSPTGASLQFVDGSNEFKMDHRLRLDSGTDNLPLALESSDANVQIQMVDSGGYCNLTQASGAFYVQPTGSAGFAVFNSRNCQCYSNLDVSGDLDVDGVVYAGQNSSGDFPLRIKSSDAAVGMIFTDSDGSGDFYYQGSVAGGKYNFRDNSDDFIMELSELECTIVGEFHDRLRDVRTSDKTCTSTTAVTCGLEVSVGVNAYYRLKSLMLVEGTTALSSDVQIGVSKPASSLVYFTNNITAGGNEPVTTKTQLTVNGTATLMHSIEGVFFTGATSGTVSLQMNLAGIGGNVNLLKGSTLELTRLDKP